MRIRSNKPFYLGIGSLLWLWMILIHDGESLCSVIQQYKTTLDRRNFAVETSRFSFFTPQSLTWPISRTSRLFFSSSEMAVTPTPNSSVEKESSSNLPLPPSPDTSMSLPIATGVPSALLLSLSSGGAAATAALQKSSKSSTSRMVSIRSYGLLTGGRKEQDEIIIHLQPQHKLIAVTGETGSGKSVLVAKALEFVSGAGKTTSLASNWLKNNNFSSDPSASGTKNQNNEESAKSTTTATAIASTTTTTTTAVACWVQLDLRLDGEHRIEVENLLEQLGLDASLLDSQTNNDESSANLILKRTLLLQNTNPTASPRIKSLCQINGQTVSLKTLSSIARPLVAVIDATGAANALSTPETRLAIIDSAVPKEILVQTAQAKQQYKAYRKYRETLQTQQRNEILPKSFMRSNTPQDKKLLDHWVNELSAFERRVMKFCSTIPIDDSLDQSLLDIACQKLTKTTWMDSTSSSNQPFVSAIFVNLSNLRDAILSLEDQIRSAQLCIDSLSSLSSPQSAITALERARKLLIESVGDESNAQQEESRIAQAAEKSHQLLNELETALYTCTRFIEDNDRGLLSSLQDTLSRYPIAVDEINEIILEWNTLSRKHGISPYSLPSCHRSLQKERDGGLIAQEQMTMAIAQEQNALRVWQEIAQELTLARCRVAQQLSASVTKDLPALGMERASFRVDVKSPSMTTSTTSATSNNMVNDFMISQLFGSDEIDFVLLHTYHQSSKDGNVMERGGKVSEVASSGEKARILLAIECALPGSVGISLGDTRADDLIDARGFNLPRSPPLAVVYDEIDAHVGGNAAVAVSAMLTDQSFLKQVVAITHSPTIAAGADAHVVIRRKPSSPFSPKEYFPVVDCRVVDGIDRCKELARMASGDMVVEEAEMFATALIREATARKAIRTK